MRPRHTPPPRWWAHPDTWLWAAGCLAFLAAYFGAVYASVDALALPADNHDAATPQAVATDWTWDTTSAPMTTIATAPSSSSVYASAVVTARASVSRACRCAPRQPVATTSLAPTTVPQTTTAQTTTAPASISPHTTPPSSTTPRSTRTTTAAASTPPTTTAPSSSAPSSTTTTAEVTPTTFQASEATTAATSEETTAP